jgi:hypothetical protein
MGFLFSPFLHYIYPYTLADYFCVISKCALSLVNKCLYLWLMVLFINLSRLLWLLGKGWGNQQSTEDLCLWVGSMISSGRERERNFLCN